jgi:hypothetical protein
VPFGKEEVVMASGGGAFTVKLSACAAEVTDAASVTVTEKFVVAAAFGVPLITPVLAFSVAQLGSAPLDTFQLSAPVPPVACSVAL